MLGVSKTGSSLVLVLTILSTLMASWPSMELVCCCTNPNASSNIIPSTKQSSCCLKHPGRCSTTCCCCPKATIESKSSTTCSQTVQPPTGSECGCDFCECPVALVQHDSDPISPLSSDNAETIIAATLTTAWVYDVTPSLKDSLASAALADAPFLSLDPISCLSRQNC